MSEGRGLLSRLDDAFNPVVVRELRQAVRGKFVTSVLLMLLVIQLVAIGIYLMTATDLSQSLESGRNVFMILHSILMIICLLFVPAYTAFRLGSERSDTNVDLLFITTITPRAIIWGKLFAAITITILIFSACMPFMVFTYWLRGIDLPSIFIMLGFAFLVIVATIQFATFIASIPANRVLKVLMGVLGLCILPQLLVATLSGSYALLTFGVGSRLNSWSFWGPASAVILIVLALIGLFFSLSVALITPVSANRALAVRLYAVITWFVGGVFSFIIGYIDKSNVAIIVWAIASVSIFFLGFFVSSSERQEVGARIVHKIPRNPLLRVPAFLLFSGAAGGIFWCSTMCALTFLAIGLQRMLSHGVGRDGLKGAMMWVAGLGLYGFCYSMTAVFIRRIFLESRLRAKFTWLIAVILLIIGSVAPLVAGFLVTGRAPTGGVWLIGNPFAFGNDRDAAMYLVFSGLWAGLVAALNFGWFAEQIRSFRPLGSSPSKEEEFVRLAL